MTRHSKSSISAPILTAAERSGHNKSSHLGTNATRVGTASQVSHKAFFFTLWCQSNPYYTELSSWSYVLTTDMYLALHGVPEENIPERCCDVDLPLSASVIN